MKSSTRTVQIVKQMNMPRQAAGLALLALVLHALPAGAQAPAVADSLATPVPTGSHAVGRRLLHWVDSTRRDPTDSSHLRALVAWVWYPAEGGGDHAGELALGGAWGERHVEESVPKIGARAAAALRGLRVHAHTDAPLARTPAALPVLLFFPGLGWLPSDYSALAEDLASHGYVVVGVASPGLSATVQLSDGRQVARVLGVGPNIGTDQVHAHDDARFAMAQLRRLDEDAEDGFAGRLDLARVGAFGHSLGGTTSLVLAAGDTSVRAALNIDGDPMGVVRDVRPRQPILLLSSESPPIAEFPHPADSQQRALVSAGLERSEQRRTAEWQRIAGSSRRADRLHVLGARHSDFLDVTLVGPSITDPKLRWMRVGPIAGERALRITQDVVRGFFDRELRGGLADPLVQLERLHPELRRLPPAGAEVAASPR